MSGQIDEGSNTPPDGNISSSLGSDGPSIPAELDIRVKDTVIPPPIPMGSSYAVDVTEILKRGFVSLDIDEQAKVVAAYLATQRHQLSPFMTPIDEEVARHKLELEQQQTKANTAFRIFTFILALCTVVGILVLIGLFVNMALKQGVLNDAGIMQGIFSAVQEVFRAIFTRNY